MTDTNSTLDSSLAEIIELNETNQLVWRVRPRQMVLRVDAEGRAINEATVEADLPDGGKVTIHRVDRPEISPRHLLPGERPKPSACELRCEVDREGQPLTFTADTAEPADALQTALQKLSTSAFASATPAQYLDL